jgi:hypothetical protein
MAMLKSFILLTATCGSKTKEQGSAFSISIMAVTCGSTIYLQHTVAVQWQQWLCKWTTMRCYTHVAYLVVLCVCPALNFLTNFLLSCPLSWMILMKQVFFTELLATFFFLYAYSKRITENVHSLLTTYILQACWGHLRSMCEMKWLVCKCLLQLAITPI